MSLHRLIWALALLSTALLPAIARAEGENCASASDRACIAGAILKDAGAIAEPQWHDSALRELAISLTYDKRIDDAVALIPKITNPDTQAMTIRGIGMAAALYSRETPNALKAVFVKLSDAAKGITLPAANAIAQTYIAMAQAFGGLDDDAWATAEAMTNPALKHKAFGETAEIQAERGDVDKAMTSISKIDVASYRNKSYQTVSEILIKQDKFDAALKSAQMIDNPAKRAQALQAILHAQEEKTRGTRQDVVNGAVPE
jgi:hypothetical protein